MSERPVRAFDAVRWVVAARVRLDELSVDRVVAHWAVPCAWPIALPSLLKARPTRRAFDIEVVSHGADVRLLASLPRAVRNHVTCTIAEQAIGWRFVSETLHEQLAASLRPDVRRRVDRISRIGAPAIELPDVREAAARLRQSFGARGVAVSAGRLIAAKRVDRAIDDAARPMISVRSSSSGDGPERRRLEDLARQRGIIATFVGLLPRGETLAWIAAADVLVHASESEGLSTAIVREAEALGTRVVRL